MNEIDRARKILSRPPFSPLPADARREECSAASAPPVDPPVAERSIWSERRLRERREADEQDARDKLERERARVQQEKERAATSDTQKAAAACDRRIDDVVDLLDELARGASRFADSISATLTEQQTKQAAFDALVSGIESKLAKVQSLVREISDQREPRSPVIDLPPLPRLQ